MLKIIGETHPGRVRSMNQDMFSYGLFGDNCGYAVVCDGMGGAQAGDVASKVACDMVSAFLSRDLRPELSASSVKGILLSAASAANAKVYNMAKEKLEYSGMGTTLVVAVWMESELHVISIGDSRLYLVDQKGSQVTQVTRDHTVTQYMVELGELSPEEALTHERRHQLTRVLGVSDSLDVDYQLLELELGQRVLLCTDGLSNYAGEDVLPKLVKKAVRGSTTKFLVDYANNRGGSDNITAVILYRL